MLRTLRTQLFMLKYERSSAKNPRGTPKLSRQMFNCFLLPTPAVICPAFGPAARWSHFLQWSRVALSTAITLQGSEASSERVRHFDLLSAELTCVL